MINLGFAIRFYHMRKSAERNKLSELSHCDASAPTIKMSVISELLKFDL